MMWNFIKLEWKAFSRATSFKFNIIIKVILGIAAVFYGLMFLFLGVAAYYGLEEEGLEPLSTVNRYLIYWWIGDLIIRYFLQKTPTMWVRPFLPLPIFKRKLTHYLLGKSLVSFFNIYPIFFFVPFSVVLLINGYSILGVVSWHLAIMSLSFFNNFLNLIVNNKTGIFITLTGLLIAGGVLQYYGYVDITLYTTPIFQAFYELLWPMFIVAAMTIVLYRYTYRFYYRSLYLDDAVTEKPSDIKVKEYNWLNRFGLMGEFLKNDLRLILRNKRSRTTLWMSGFFLFYGLFIFTVPEYRESDMWLVFAGIFISGGFLFTFGGFVPSWDSSYYPLMMSQNIQYKEYLASKWWLIIVATVTSMLLSSFYLFFGVEIYLAILAGGIYNIGINGYVVLLGGAYVKTPIDLNSGKKPFGDSGAFNLKTILLSIPKIVLPIVIFFVFKILFGTVVGFLAIALTGVVGLAFRNLAFSLIESVYKEEKYDTIHAYEERG